ncbi:hypothetical protein RQP46_002976 [Phenoliferia psychrophenolica]
MHVRDGRLSRYSVDDMPSPSTRPASFASFASGSGHRPMSSDSSSLRSTSPFMKKLKWKRDDDLDFECAGENANEREDRSWTDGPSDFSDRHYGHRSLNRSSVTSSIPSLTHSRGHSSSSDVSASTVESSLPPSPTPSCGFASPLSHSTRVPLTPRTSERKRRSDEVAAIDALNDYFVRVRLSRVEEDEVTPPRRVATAGLGVSSSSPLGLDALEIEFLETGHSTYTSFMSPPSPEQTFSPFLSLPASPNPNSLLVGHRPYSPAAALQASDSGHSTSSGSSTIPARSPDPEADDMAGTLDALSAYFTRPTTPRTATQPYAFPATGSASRPHHSRQASYSQESHSSHVRPASSSATYGAQSTRASRPKFSSQGSISSFSPSRPNPVVADRRVPYGWI